MVDETKKIWILWLQGEQKMPKLVRMCYESWCFHNPDYEIILLDNKSIDTYVKIDPRIRNNKNLSPQVISNIVRVKLLLKYGGVWADATLYCMKPLSSWISNYLQSGFFAFDRPKKTRMLCNWFLAGQKGNKMLKEIDDIYSHFWIKYPNLRVLKNTFLVRFFTFSETSFLFPKYYHKKQLLMLCPLLMKWFKVYPYYVFHYLVEKKYYKKGVIKEIWDKTPKFSAVELAIISSEGLNATIKQRLINEIKSQEIPVYKLSVKTEIDDEKKDSNISYLFDYHNNLLNKGDALITD